MCTGNNYISSGGGSVCIEWLQPKCLSVLYGIVTFEQLSGCRFRRKVSNPRINILGLCTVESIEMVFSCNLSLILDKRPVSVSKTCAESGRKLTRLPGTAFRQDGIHPEPGPHPGAELDLHFMHFCTSACQKVWSARARRAQGWT